MSRIAENLEVCLNKKFNTSNAKDVEDKNIVKAKNYYSNLVNTVAAEMGGRSRQVAVFANACEEKAVSEMINKAMQ